MKFPVTYDFEKEDSAKAQALKVLEEAAEFVEAVKFDPNSDSTAEEAMDLYQALANYLNTAFYEQEIQAAYDAVFTKNWERGYYDCNYGGTMYDRAKLHYEELMANDD